MTSSPSPPDIVITGSASAGKTYLATCLFPELKLAVDDRCLRFASVCLKTKYYRAELTLCIARPDQLHFIDLSHSQAFIYVFNGADEHVLDRLPASVEMLQLPINLAISNDPFNQNIDSTAKLPDFGCEQIHVVFGETLPVAGHQATRNSQSGDLAGVGRFREVLECHVWPTLVKLDPRGHLGESRVLGPGPSTDQKPVVHSSIDELDHFEGLISMVRRIKEQGAALPDDERRRIASDAMEQLLCAFDLVTDEDIDEGQ